MGASSKSFKTTSSGDITADHTQQKHVAKNASYRPITSLESLKQKVFLLALSIAGWY